MHRRGGEGLHIREGLLSGQVGDSGSSRIVIGVGFARDHHPCRDDVGSRSEGRRSSERVGVGLTILEGEVRPNRLMHHGAFAIHLIVSLEAGDGAFHHVLHGDADNHIGKVAVVGVGIDIDQSDVNQSGADDRCGNLGALVIITAEGLDGNRVGFTGLHARDGVGGRGDHSRDSIAFLRSEGDLPRGLIATGEPSDHAGTVLDFRGRERHRSGTGNGGTLLREEISSVNETRTTVGIDFSAARIENFERNLRIIRSTMPTQSH